VIPLTVPEVRRLILAMTGPYEERDFRLGWSLWRRAHQAVAKRCHAAKRELLLGPRVPGGVQSEPVTTPATPLPAPMSGRLSDTQWARVESLVPRNGGRGRQWRDHRRVIDGMLWVHASGASWRDLPEEEFGPWQTIYDRYNKWRKEGIWQQIAELLRCQP
jgi:putative transposase of IS4/5 family DUF4096